MKYQDLVQFDTIEGIIVLTKSKEKSEAQKLVSSYVISDTMADRLLNIVFKQLQFEEQIENTGLLVIGNYGTGKSHLMSVISSIAADADIVSHLRNSAVANAAKSIAGKHKVIRIEIGSVTTPLREIIVNELENFLAAEGIDFDIPAQNTIINNKIWLEDMMAEFNRKYPDKGLLFVIDELLDYLRQKADTELVADFGFIRELGEVCKTSRFRFIAGLQEAIFDNPRFKFASETLNRVKDRCQEVQISRNDIKYVVAERLLRKTPEQRQKVREYLEQFAPFYSDMTSRMDDFVQMFPVHPDYIEIFDRLVVVEKRMVLRTLSDRMSAMLSQEVPDGYPGIIAYDSYWETISGNPSYRTNEDLKPVLDCANILANKIKFSLKKQFLPMAYRIINGLAVNRLTTGGIDKPIGVTATELRDTLCLFDPNVRDLGGTPDEDLQGLIEVVLNEIRKVVSGQYISYNNTNNQYYIDINRTEDFDTLIEQRAASLDADKLDQAFYEALKIMMEVQDVPSKVTGYHIWQFDKLKWLDHNAPRIGYLFFGAPNERSTAQPARDYYIYHLRHFSPVRFRNENKSDEVFFKLSNLDEDFIKSVKSYAGALDLWQISSGAKKASYENKMREHLRAITKWLGEKNTQAFEVTYQGQTKSISNWLTGTNLRQLSGISGEQTLSFRDMITLVCSYLLGPNFATQAPSYPVFKTYIPQVNRANAVSDALRVIAGGHSKYGLAVLDALQLLDGDMIVTKNSIYAQKVLEFFKDRPAGQVVNREELIGYIGGVEYFDVTDARLEPDFLVVVLAALVYTGDVTLSVVGRKYDAAGVSMLAAADVDDLINFKHIEQPKDWNIAGLKALFELVGLQSGYVSLVTQGKDDPVRELQAKLDTLVRQIVVNQNNIRNGMDFMGVDLLAVCGYRNAGGDLNKAKDFLEHMQNFNAPAKLKQFKQSAEEVSVFVPAVKMLNILGKLQEFYQSNNVLAAYLNSAELNLPADNMWISQLKEVRSDIVQQLSGVAAAEDMLKILPVISQVLKGLKRDYIVSYKRLHDNARMSAPDEMKRNTLQNDARLKTLLNMAAIEIMPRQKLSEFQNKLSALRSCNNLTELQLESNACCPHCQYSPSREGVSASAADMLKQMDEQLDTLLENWTNTLLNDMEDPVAQKNIELLKQEDASAIKEFLAKREMTDNTRLIPALQQILNGLKKVSFKLSDVEHVLQSAGPAKPEELKQRFAEYVDSMVRGEDPNKIRIVLE